MKNEGLEVGTIIQKGIDKVESYSGLAFEIPAYLLSMGEWLS